MTYTDTFVAGNICIFFNAPIKVPGDRSMKFRITIDGVGKIVSHIEGIQEGGQQSEVPASLVWVETVTSAEHTIKVQWLVASGTAYQYGSTKGSRLLTIQRGFS